MNRLLLISAMVFLCTHIASPSLAMFAGSGIRLADHDGSLTTHIRADLGVLNGMSWEYAYDDQGRKVSELQWEIENVAVAGGVFSVRFRDRVQFNLGGWTDVSSGSGSLENYDWNYTWDEVNGGTRWSDWSQSDVTASTVMLDANIALQIFHYKEFFLDGLAGFRFDYWKFEDSGGEFIYSRNDFRDTQGNFNGTNGIDYKQWFYAPYLGVETGFSWDRLQIKSHIAGTVFAWAEAEDQHHLRGVMFEDDFTERRIKYLNIGADATLKMTSQLSLSLGLAYHHYYKSEGDTRKSGAEGNVFFEDGAGIEHESMMATIGVGYTF